MAAAAILIALSGMAAQAQPNTDITRCPYTISATGVYNVKNELDCSSADGISITASNVTLKLNGFTISGNGGAGGGGIHVNPNGTSRLLQVNIEGPGLIQDFISGVVYEKTDFSQVSRVTTARTFSGFFVFGAVNMVLQFNVAGKNEIGFELSDCFGCTVTGNVASGNDDTGIAIGGGGLGFVSGNTANGNFNAGIYLGDTVANLVYGNTVNGNGSSVTVQGTGIEVNGGGGNQIFSNTSVRGNAGSDLQDSAKTCNVNLWTNNTFFIGSPSCVR